MYIYAHCLFRLLFLSIISTAYRLLSGSWAAKLLLNWLVGWLISWLIDWLIERVSSVSWLNVVSSVLWCCWLSDGKGVQPVKKLSVGMVLLVVGGITDKISLSDVSSRFSRLFRGVFGRLLLLLGRETLHLVNIPATNVYADMQTALRKTMSE